MPAWRQHNRFTRATLAAILAVMVGVNVLTYGALKMVFPGLSLFPRAEASAPASDRVEQVIDAAQRTDALPAEAVIDQVLAAPATALPGPGWAAAPEPGGATGTPFDWICGTPGGPAPVVSDARGWVFAPGSQATDVQGAITISMRAYSAGQGAVAFQSFRKQVAGCDNGRDGGAAVASRSGVGTEAALAWTRSSGGSVAAMLWRRGDVIGMVAARGGTGAVPDGLVAEYDARLTQALAGVCAELGSTAADGARSPYAHREGFTGLTVERQVTLAEAAPPSPATSAPPTPAQTGSPAPTEQPIPGPTASLPKVTLPVRPADPVYPEQLPTPVPRPTAPQAPEPATTSASYPERVRDEVGPGCGWAFTGQAVPPFTDKNAQADAEQAKVAALAGLRADADRYEQEKAAYLAAYQQYLTQVDAFVAYAAEVDQVSQAWAAIQAERGDYDAATAAYERAVAAREKFLADQQATYTAYTAAVEACRIEATKPKSTPAPTATAKPTPTPTATSTTPQDEEVAGASVATPAPTPTATATPAPTSTLVCPAPRPTILDQQPPMLPEPPAPPADPRPVTAPIP